MESSQRPPDDPGRRALLRLGAVAATGLTPALPAAAADDWTAQRRAFRLAGPAPLNAANLCPARAAVLDAQQGYAERLNADVGFINRRDFVRGSLAGAREACARMLGLRDGTSLALVRNTTEGNAVIVGGLDLAPDDEVLLWDQNHASNYRAWHYRHRRWPFRVRGISLPGQPRGIDELVAPFVAALSRKTRVVAFSQLSNISGLRLPAREICAAIHAERSDVLIHIDGAQSWGCMAVDLDAVGCDSFAASGHKWLCGPRGTGVLMVREKWARRMHPSILGYDFAFEFPGDELPDDARRFECLGQRDTAACAALGVAVAEHEAIGMNAIETRIASLTRHALQAFDRAGIPTRTPKDPAFGHGVVVADLGATYKAFGAFLALHNAGYAAAYVHGNTVHCSPSGPAEEDGAPSALRICPHIYNSTEDIDEAVAIARRIRDSNFEIVKEVVRFL